MPSVRQLLFTAILASFPGVLLSQVPCSTPDSIAVRGNQRMSRAAVLADADVQPGTRLDYTALRAAIDAIFSSAQFDSVGVDCVVQPGPRSILVFTVVERPPLGRVTVTGAEQISERQVREKVRVFAGRALDPAEVSRSLFSIDSLYRSRSFYLARIRVDSVRDDAGVNLNFVINEGRRLAVSGIQIEGNEHLSDEEIVAAMATKPEGFWWFRSGEFSELRFDADVADSLPALYADRGFIDMRVLSDTIIADPVLGKALIVITVDEGPQYRVGTFDIVGNRYFGKEELLPLYPFDKDQRSLTQKVRALLGAEITNENLFKQSMWDRAQQDVTSMYWSAGFISADIRPIIERSVAEDSTPVVNLLWDINEQSQAIVNRIEIIGNNYTVESCIRNQIAIFPGSVFNTQLLQQSYQRLSAMQFFEEPLPFPDVRPVGDSGLFDIAFQLQEKRTGNLNFGASMGGGGAGLGGFIGFDQPNLFGKCKRGSLNWQFGRLINEFNLSYSDPSIRRSNYSGSIDAYHLRSRYVVSDFGRQTRTGAYVRLGFPLLRSLTTRASVSYGGERVKYSRDESSLLGQLAGQCDNCFRSTFGMNVSRDTRIGLPFAIAGSYQTVDAQLNGGPLGGTADFQRISAEFRNYAPLASLGGSGPGGGQPIYFTMGLTVRTGLVFGSTGPFFPFQEFSMGGVQQGEPLRGYDEFTITPNGFVYSGSVFQAQRSSFGRAFMSTTAEIGMKPSQTVYLNAFFDAGNVWSSPTELNPSRMFRGAGVGVGLVTPLGPLGLDWAYGFDRLDQFGRPDPGWKLHFKLGQLF